MKIETFAVSVIALFSAIIGLSVGMMIGYDKGCDNSERVWKAWQASWRKPVQVPVQQPKITGDSL